MSNLISRPGFSPGAPLAEPTQWVQVRELQNGPSAVASGGIGGGDDEIDLRELWRALRRRRKWVAVTAAGVVGLSLLVTAYQRLFRPIYEGSFSLLISDPINSEDRGSANAALQSGVFEQLARNTTQADLPTLIEVLRSPALLQPITQRYNLTAAQLASRITIASGGERNKQAEGVLHVTVTGRDPVADERLLDDLSAAYLQAALTQRQQRLADGINFLDRQAPQLQQRSAELQQQLAAFRERHNLLQPSEEGAALRGKVVEQGDAVRALNAERSRLQAVRQSIANGTITATGFQEAIGTGPSTAGGSQTQGLSVADANQGLLEQLTKLDQQLADARARFTAKSSIVQGLEARRRQLLPLLRRNQLEAVDSALGLNAARLATARQQEQQLNADFRQQPQLIRQYEQLQQNLLIANDNLASFLKTRETFQLELAQRSVPWRVIAPPTINPDPVSPSVPRNLALGTLLGLVAGAGAGLLRDRLDHVFHSPAELREELQQPLLGHIPHVPFFAGVREQKRFLLEELDRGIAGATGAESAAPADEAAELLKLSGYQRFFYQEAFRNLFTSLRFLNSDKPLRSVALTSSIPAEGKSLVNVLLAKTLAEMGQRVLLVDADMRKPQMHHRLGLNNLVGLSNLLTEDDLNWRDVVQTMPSYDGWTVLTAGRRPPDPARLLSSPRMHQLVAELAASQAFDLILYDTPPVLGLADAALLAEQLDGLMLLVSLDRVDRGLPREAVARIRSSGAPLLGLVTNAIKQDSQGAPAYGYGYGQYGYGSSYGYGAYNSGNAYAYYATSEPTPSPAAASGPTPSGPLARAQGQWRRFVRWVDR